MLKTLINQRKNTAIFTAVALSPISLLTAGAHQPVMDMAPRWADGYGVQIRHESYGSDKLMNGDSEIANPLGLKKHVKKTWLEGVYTFDRSKRVTFKLPYVQQTRVTNINGVATHQKNQGIGDLILGVPLKKYFNKGAQTGNWGFTPSLRLPTGSTDGDFPISDGSVDLGLSVSYSSENPDFYDLYDLFYWINTEGEKNMNEGNELGFDANWGIHPYHNNDTNSGMFLMWDVSARHKAESTTAFGGSRIHTGPVMVLYRDNIMFRTEYKMPVYENMNSNSVSRGNEFTIGIGVTF